MNIERFKDIINYSDKNRQSMEQKVAAFYKEIGMDINETIRNLLQIVRPIFSDRDYIIVEMPFKDREIGALCYRGDSIGYIFLNTSLPRVNVNFALCHEVYHVFYQKSGLEHKIDLYLNEQYYEHEEELAANLFAGMVLMPEYNFKYMFDKFVREEKSSDNRISVLAKLMNYFEVPYMAVLIRCYELGLLESGNTLKELLNLTKENLKEVFSKLWLEEEILIPSKKDDFTKFELFVQLIGTKYVEEEYLSKRALDKALKNMNLLYQKIKEE